MTIGNNPDTSFRGNKLTPSPADLRYLLQLRPPDLCASEMKIFKAIAYEIDKGNKEQIKFQQILKKIGFEVKLKPFIQRSDGSAKGDWDVGITLDMIDYAEDVDAIVLASGDGDFDLLIDKIRNEYNVSVEIYGVPNLTAQSLIDSATKFIPIEGNLLLSM